MAKIIIAIAELGFLFIFVTFLGVFKSGDVN